MRVPWSTLPREDAALFNPGFVSVLLARSAIGHSQEVARPIPIPIAFVAVSVALHRWSRESLPNSIRTNFVRWLDEHPDATTTLPIRAAAFAPVASEGLLFGLAHGLFEITNGATIAVPAHASLGGMTRGTAETQATQRAAVFLGRWLGKAGSPATVLSLLGVRP